MLCYSLWVFLTCYLMVYLGFLRNRLGQTGRVPALSPTAHLTLFIYTKRTFCFLRNTSTLIKSDPNQAIISQQWGKSAALRKTLICSHIGSFCWGYGVAVSPHLHICCHGTSRMKWIMGTHIRRFEISSLWCIYIIFLILLCLVKILYNNNDTKWMKQKIGLLFGLYKISIF